MNAIVKKTPPYPITDADREQSLINIKRWRRERERLAAVVLSTDLTPVKPVPTLSTAEQIAAVIQPGMTLYQLSRKSGFAVRTIQGHLRGIGWKLVAQNHGGAIVQNAPHVFARIVEAQTNG